MTDIYEQTDDGYAIIDQTHADNFTKVKNYIIDMWQPILTGIAIDIYITLKRFSRESKVSRFSVEQLEYATGFNNATIKKYSDILEAFGFMRCKTPNHKQRKEGIRKVYVLLDPPCKVTEWHVKFAQEKGICTTRKGWTYQPTPDWLTKKQKEVEVHEPTEFDIWVQKQLSEISGYQSDISDSQGEISDRYSDISDLVEDYIEDYIEEKISGEISDEIVTTDFDSEDAGWETKNHHPDVGKNTNNGVENSNAEDSTNGIGQSSTTKALSPAEFAKKHRQRKQSVVQNGSAPDAMNIMARNQGSRVNVTDLPANHVARVVIGAVETHSHRSVKAISVAQCQILSEPLFIKDGQRMESPQWYYEQYPKQYRAFVEEHVIEGVRSMKKPVALKSFIDIITHPEWYHGWLRYADEHGLTQGMPEVVNPNTGESVVEQERLKLKEKMEDREYY